MKSFDKQRSKLHLLQSDVFERSYESELMQLKIIDGVLVGQYFPVDGVLSLEFMKSAVEERYSFTKKETFPFLLYVGNVKGITKGCREYSSTDEAAYDVLVSAFIVRNKFTEYLANFFLRINKPKVKVKLFSNEYEAFIWLKTYVQEGSRVNENSGMQEVL